MALPGHQSGVSWARRESPFSKKTVNGITGAREVDQQRNSCTVALQNALSAHFRNATGLPAKSHLLI